MCPPDDSRSLMPQCARISDDELRTAFRELRAEIARHGWTRKPTRRTVLELGAHLATMTGGIALSAVATGTIAYGIGIILATAGMMGVASNTHTSSHHATSDRRWINEALTLFGCSFVLGLSATYWWDKHLKHHAAPNVHGDDEDASFAPWFALTDREVNAAGRAGRTYYRHVQCFVFPIAIALNAPNMQKNGVVFLCQEIRRRHGRRMVLWLDALGLAGHFGLNTALPYYLWGCWGLAPYALRLIAFSYAMFAFFGPAHLPGEAVAMERAPTMRGLPFLLAATVNFRAGWIGRWLASGLDDQIEHHMFPDISHVHYRALRPLVKEFCRTQGLPYRRMPWTRALRSALRVLRVPKPLLRESDVRAFV